MANPLLPKPKPPSRPTATAPQASRPSPTGIAGKPTAPAPSSLPGRPAVTVGRPQSPQKPANLLDNMVARPAPEKPKKPVDTSDHGAVCVCKDCRAKKLGKGGSLFPDL